MIFLLIVHVFSFDVAGVMLLSSGFSDDCRVPQGFVFALEKSSKLFRASPLAYIIRPDGGLKYLQIYHSVTGGDVISAQDNNNNLRFVEWQAQEIKRTLFDVGRTVPQLQSNTKRWEAVADEMLADVTKARYLLSSASDWVGLKVLVKELDDDLDIISRAFDLLIAKLQPYRNETSINSFIDRLIKLRADLPKAISLSFSKSVIQQNFMGFRFLLTAQICQRSSALQTYTQASGPCIATIVTPTHHDNKPVYLLKELLWILFLLVV